MNKKKIFLTRIIIFVLSIILLLLQKFNSKSFFLFQQPNILIYKQKTPDKDDLEKENKKLKKEILKLQQQLSTLSAYRDLYKKVSRNFKIISFLNVISINKNVNNSYIIAKTTNERVNLNDFIVDSDLFLIGRVVKIVDNNIVKIQLLNDINSYIPVKTLQGNSYCLLSGEWHLEHKCNIVLQECNLPVKEGEQIITSGEYGLGLQGINVGIVNIQNDKYCVKSLADKNINNLLVIRGEEM